MLSIMGVPGGLLLILVLQINTGSTSGAVVCGYNVCPLGMDCINGIKCADPCDHYTALHDEWRSTNNTVNQVLHCDQYVNWQGWYRLFLGQTSAHIPERCVAENRCGTHAPLWITEPHPTQYNKIVNRTVCNAWLGSCCHFPSHIIQVKLCYGNYYVYKLVKPSNCHLAYCAEVNRTEPAVASTTSDPRPQSSTIAHPPTSTRSVPSAQTLQFNCEHNVCPLGMDCINGTSCANPCDHYTALHDEWRSTNNTVYQSQCDRNVNWQGWYRLFLGQTSAHIPERCVAENRCGTHAPLWITEPHPAQYNEIVNRTVCNAWLGSCCYFPSHIIQVKLCYGNYYVYKLVKPSVCQLAYCAEVNRTEPAVASTTSDPRPQSSTIAHPPTSTRSVPSAQTLQFNCEHNVCPLGMDCINGTGCADPCDHYTALHDEWRSTNYAVHQGLHCDRNVNWQGWYRLFLGQTSAHIPERCVAENRCGTHAPLWITEPHPAQYNEIVNRTVCNAWSGSCCRFRSHIIQVKLCYGNYYVYKLVKPSNCHLAYCAVQHHPLRPSQLICGRDKLQVGLDLASMTSSGFNPFTGNLAARNCSSFRVLDGVVWYEVEAKAGPCGNTLTTNHTHAIYSNTLFIYPMDNTSFAVPVSLPFSCAYPLETNTSLNVAVRPFLEHGGISGSGAKVRASMFLFRNSTYTKTYPAGQITLPVGSPLYVGVYVDEKDTNFAAVLEDCYATHSSNPDDPVRYSLIQNKCPTDRRQVSVVESGSSLRARFSALFFLPQGEYRDVFLHCSLRLCDQRSSLCVPSCTRRARRSLSTSTPMKPLTIGPIMWDKSPE
ncbi:LOW QUALITY PROTEIN: uncharacterized protein LOC128375818 [Scomber scombrus]|uniref:LOW QUALITY PROTEIN: uncharacterized protein LOC128375818 n=1 Tax=Scomber scombrus TaxID=13677 RepID=A0AAV1QD93_SCOSC